jgi:hypothetical protein
MLSSSARPVTTGQALPDRRRRRLVMGTGPPPGEAPGAGMFKNRRRRGCPRKGAVPLRSNGCAQCSPPKVKLLRDKYRGDQDRQKSLVISKNFIQAGSRTGNYKFPKNLKS